MYSKQRIPAPFGRPPRQNAAPPQPASPEPPVEEKPISIQAAEDAASQPKASTASPLLALLLFDLFSNKEG